MENSHSRVKIMSDASMTKNVAIGTVGTVLGFTWSEWAAIATAVYMICQIVVILPKVIETVKKWTSKKDLPPQE